MQPRHIRPALFAALAALLLAAGLAPARVSVAEASEEPPEGETITTVLHPGWNMIGWVGPETAASELFGAIPQLQTVAMWNAWTQQYTHSWRISSAGGRSSGSVRACGCTSAAAHQCHGAAWPFPMV